MTSDCHPERSEGSRCGDNEMLRFVQHDGLVPFLAEVFQQD